MLPPSFQLSAYSPKGKHPLVVSSTSVKHGNAFSLTMLLVAIRLFNIYVMCFTFNIKGLSVSVCVGGRTGKQAPISSSVPLPYAHSNYTTG